MNWLQKPLKRLLITLFVALLGLGTASCGAAETGGSTVSRPARGALSEVSPPYTIQVLKQALDLNQPQVKILSPRPNQVINDTQVAVKLQVKDLSLFKDEELGLGPYLQILLDSQPYRQVHSSKPVVLENLSPGTHTLRVLAVRPWHESFKNDGAFAQTTFHVFTPTAENNPHPNKPLLTYNYPQGVYGAEPVLLDFFLTNAPLHLVAREDPKDAIPDWKIRCTINGESFTFDRWEPIYLKGLRPGKNWVQLELIDDQDRLLPNVFNSAVQLVTYEPGGNDTLARLTRGELTADGARKIVDPNYVAPIVPPEPEIKEPEAAEPEVTEPKAVEPQESPEPQIVAPKVLQPNATEPEPAAEPSLSKPSLPEPNLPELIPPQPVDRLDQSVVEPKPEPKGIAPVLSRPELNVSPARETPEPDLPQSPVQPIKQPGQPELSPARINTTEAKPDRFNQLEGDRPKQFEPKQPKRIDPRRFNFEQPPEKLNSEKLAPEQLAPENEQPVDRPVETPAFKPLPTERPQPLKLPELERPAPPNLVPPAPPKLDIPPALNVEPGPQKLNQVEEPTANRANRYSEQSIPKPEPKPDSLKAIEDRLNQLLQPASTTDAADSLLETSPDFSGQSSLQPISPLDPIAPAPSASQPDLFGVLDRVKAFFEGLKRPAQDKPLLSPLLQPASEELPAFDSGEPTVIDTLIDVLPESLRQSVLEELEQPAGISSSP